MRWRFVLLWGAVTAGAWAAETTEHQRVGVAKAGEHRWEVSLGTTLVPWGSSAWDLTLGPRVSYELFQTWSAYGSLPYTWAVKEGAQGPRGRWEDFRAGVSWRTKAGEPRWRTGVSFEGPVVPRTGWNPWRSTGEVGVSLVRDPIIVGGAVLVSVPLSWGGIRTWTGGATLSFQDLVNDSWLWNLSVSPRVVFSGTGLRWSVSLAWGFGWFEGPVSLSTDLGAGTGSPWALSGTGGVSW